MPSCYPLYGCIKLSKCVTPLPKQADAQRLDIFWEFVFQNLEGAPRLCRYQYPLPRCE